MLMMISHGVEISIAGGVEEIVCDPNPSLFFFSFFFFILALFCLLGTKSTCRVKLWDKKTSYNEPTGAR